jgi:hypothetical protein
MLTEISQTQKKRLHNFAYTRNLKEKVKNIEHSRTVDQESGVGVMGACRPIVQT